MRWNLSHNKLEGAIKKPPLTRKKFLVVTGITDIFLTSEREKPQYCSKKWPQISGPKVSIQRGSIVHTYVHRTTCIILACINNAGLTCYAKFRGKPQIQKIVYPHSPA